MPRGALVGVLVLVACGGDPAPPSVATVAPVASAPPPVLRLAGCAPATLLPDREVQAFDASEFGLTGMEPAGGTGWGPIGTGRYGTIGHGSGTGYGVSGHPGSRRADAPEARMGELATTGPLDQAIVRRYLRRHAAKVAYCYEKHLLARPGMRGVLTAELTIGATGEVASARARGVDPAIATCVADMLVAIEFPKPLADHTVDVRVAFTLTPHDGARPAPPIAGADAWKAATPPAPAPPPPPPPWTSFVRLADVRTAPAGDAALTTTRAAIGARLATIAACFPAGAPTGALRAVLRVDDGGTIGAATVGGFGDAAIETCVAAQLTGIALAPGDARAALACDLVRGDAAPWRVSRAGYAVVEVAPGSVKVDGAPATPGAIRADATVLVIADDAVPAREVQAALAWAGAGRTVVLTHGPAATFVSAFAMPAPGDSPWLADRARPALTVRAGQLAACVAGQALAGARVADRAALDRLLGEVAAACQVARCEGTIDLLADPGATVAELAAGADAIRRAGFAAVVGERASDAACRPR